MRIYYSVFSVIIIAGILLSSCDEYLDKTPDNRTSIDIPNDVSELLVNAYPNATYFGFCHTMSDNAGDAGIKSPFIKQYEQYFFWEVPTSDEIDTPDYYWCACYKAIAHANDAIEVIEKYKNSDGTIPNEYQAQYGEALVARAYSHFMLVNLWAKHYNPSTYDSDPGIPWVDKPEKVVIKKYKRETVKVIYKNIVEQLEEGITYIKNEAYKVPKYHFNIAAAHAFATRVYLFMGDWEKVLEHANEVLNTNTASQLRDWNGSYKDLTYKELKQRYNSTNEKSNLLMTCVISDWSKYYEYQRYGFGQKQEDEFIYSTLVCGSYYAYKIRYFTGFDRKLIPKFFELSKKLDISSDAGSCYLTAPLFSIEEVLLSRAEAQVMKKEYGAARKDLDIFFSKRVLDYTNSAIPVADENVKALYSSDGVELNPFYEIDEEQSAYLKCILRQRRTEYLFEGLRWFDIRRFNIPITHIDSEGNIFELKAYDNRKCLQIPQSAISYGIKPNPR
jgi:hypothetical protein